MREKKWELMNGIFWFSLSYKKQFRKQYQDQILL